METDSQKCLFEIEGITVEKRERNYKEVALVRGENGCAARINVFKVGRDLWSRIVLELKFEIGGGNKYPAQERLYRELIGKYGGNSIDGKWIMGIDDSNEKDIIEEIEDNPLLKNSLTELISDVMRHVYKYEAIKRIGERLKEEGISIKWKVKTCFNTKYDFIGETDLAVEHIDDKDEKKKYGQPYIDLTQFIDDKWKLWLFTRKDADDFNYIKSKKREHPYMDELVRSLKIKDFNRVWRDGNDYVILDEFEDVRDWGCGEEREKFVSRVVERVKHWTEEITTKYIDPQGKLNPDEPQNTTTEIK